MRVLFVLQNAWRKELRQKKWQGKGWEQALWQSQTGKRLKEYIPNNCEYLVINSTPYAADNCKKVLPPDLDWVLGHIEGYNPDIVVLLGRSAQNLYAYIDREVLHFPHPCYRALTKEAAAQCRESIAGMLR